MYRCSALPALIGVPARDANIQSFVPRARIRSNNSAGSPRGLSPSTHSLVLAISLTSRYTEAKVCPRDATDRYLTIGHPEELPREEALWLPRWVWVAFILIGRVGRESDEHLFSGGACRANRVPAGDHRAIETRGSGNSGVRLFERVAEMTVQESPAARFPFPADRHCGASAKQEPEG
jgi:hypothetical protein